MAKFPQAERLHFIDALRGLAALYVLLYHFVLIPQPNVYVHPAIRPLVLNGWSGVTLFFVISAFTLCFTLDQRKQRASAHGPAPALDKLFPFLASPHHGGMRFRAGGRQFRTCAGERFRAQYLFEQLAGGRIRLLAVPHYYLLVTAATLIALGEVVTRGVPPVWEKAEGTR